MSAADLDSRLDAIRATDAVPGHVLDAFERLLLEAPDEELFRMSPLRWARDNGLAEQLVIDLFLYATHNGILEFAWGILCPGCLAFMTTPGALRSVQKKHCGFCDIDVERSIDDRVEVAFTVARTVRKIRFHSPETLDLTKDAMRLNFSSSLSHESRPHRAFAGSLLHAGRAPSGTPETFRVDLTQEHTAVLAPASHSSAYLHTRAEDGPRAVTIEIFDGRAIPYNIAVPRGPVEITLVNRMADPAGYVVGPVEYGLWPKPAPPGEPLNHPILPYLTGPRLIASQVFRDLFRAESIPSEGGLELKSATLLFTDLKGSTAIYERVGDIRAYDLVRRHFSALRDVAAAEGGAIVKTIGDAIMAAFADSRDAVAAGVEMVTEWSAFAGKHPGADAVDLKVGVYDGPCTIVTANEAVDYFGQTVNRAARVQHLAGPRECVIGASLAGNVPEGRVEVLETFEARVKGIDEPLSLLRLRPRGET